MERTKDLISIIVPIFNADKVLSRCLDSLLEQTYRYYEIILINDGSKDNSLSICKEYADRASNIVVLSQKNGGTAKARNAGLNAARGEYIMFVDADDYVKEDICETLYSAIKRTKTKCVVSGHIAMNEKEESERIKCVKEERIISGKSSLHEMYCRGNRGISLVEVWGKLFHYSMWNNIRFCEGLYYEDLEIMPMLYYDCERIAEIPYAGYYYITYEESASHGKGTDDKRVWDSITIRERHIDFFNDHGDKEVAIAIISRLLDLIVTSAKNGWIPGDHILFVREIFKKYWKQYKRMSKEKMKRKLQYELFYLGGKHSFKNYNS